MGIFYFFEFEDGVGFPVEVDAVEVELDGEDFAHFDVHFEEFFAVFVVGHFGG